MPLKIAERAKIPPFIVMDVLSAANEKQAAGGSVLHLEVGQPAQGAPAEVIEAAKQALDCDRIGYSDALGIPELRGRISRFYRDSYGVEPDPDRVIATTGSSGGFLLSFLSCFEPGDRVAMAAPGYPAYRNILTALGIEPVLLETGEAERFQPTPALLETALPLDGLIVANPSNPTGTMLTKEEMRALAEFCDDQGLRFISDEIYHGITYDRRGVSALEVTDKAVVVNSFSKYFCMTGWRLGWMIVPEDLLRPMECLKQNLFISAPTLSQLAAVAAFDCREELDKRVEAYARNREVLLRELPKIGFDRLAPADGAFYLYAEVSKLTNDSVAFCKKMLEETGVATTPGVDFDPARGHRYLRFSFAGKNDDMKEASTRLAQWLEG